MEDLPEDLRSFLQKHPSFQLTDSKKIRCTLNGHEFPCSLAELELFTSGKKYKKLSEQTEFDYSQFEPHIVNSTKQPNHLFCKLTLRHINRVPQHVLRHVSGRRYLKAKAQYEECVRQGLEFVPVQLRQKRVRQPRADTGNEQRPKRKDDSGIWAPSSSADENSDSDDSMSDLYPPSMFTLKNEEENMRDDEDEFQTDDDDDDDDDEVSEMEVENQMQKRKKVQSAGFTKKFKKNRKKKGFKHVGKVNGK